jgi:hypothetical protein
MQRNQQSPAGGGGDSLSQLGPLRDQLIAGLASQAALLRSSVGTENIDAEVRQQYEQRKDELTTTCLNAILVTALPPTGATPNRQQATPEQVDAAKAKMTGIRDRITAGGDFGQIAAAESDDSQSKAKGGDLGCLNASELQQNLGPQLAQTVTNLAPGQLSDVVTLGQNFALFQVRERKTPTLDETRSQIEPEIRSQRAGRAVSDRLNEAARRQTVYVDPLFGVWDAHSASVSPPAGAAAPSTSTTNPLLGVGGVPAGSSPGSASGAPSGAPSGAQSGSPSGSPSGAPSGSPSTTSD